MAIEFDNLIFQFGTSSWGGTRMFPDVLMEQGVAMLSITIKNNVTSTGFLNESDLSLLE